jgi:hypothetical protein
MRFHRPVRGTKCSASSGGTCRHGVYGVSNTSKSLRIAFPIRGVRPPQNFPTERLRSTLDRLAMTIIMTV